MLAVSRVLSKSELEFYVRWLEYIPEHWNLNRILDKKVKNLTPFELERLLKINNDKKEALFIKKFIEMIDSKCKNKNGRISINISLDDNERLSAIIRSFNLGEYAKEKLSEEELEIINSYNEQDVLDKLNNVYAIEYFKYLIKNKEYVNNSDEEDIDSKKVKKIII